MPKTRTRREAHYEYQVVTLTKDVTRSTARDLMTAEAEYGKWELARTVLYEGGKRKMWLRRRVAYLDQP